MSRWGQFIGGVATGVIVTVSGTVLTSAYGPAIQATFSPPTCDDPKGLSRLDTVHAVTQGGLRASSTAALAGTSSESGADSWNASNLVDGRTDTVWVPADPGVGSYVDFTFRQPHDVQLICVVNGFPFDETYYYRAQRVRQATVRTDTDGSGAGVASELKSFGSEDMQNAQGLRFTTGRTTTVRITIDSVYAGRRVEEHTPDGTIIVEDPTGHTAIAEVEFYVAT